VTLIMPGQALTTSMSGEALRTLGGHLNERLDSLQQENAPHHRAMASWWRWYHAIPRVKQKNFPFANASNVIVPLIATVVDALSARTLAQTTAAAPAYWSARSENEDMMPTAREMVRYINWQADGNDFSFKQVLANALPEMHVTGQTVLAANYRRDVRPMFFGRQGARLQRQAVTFSRGPLVENVAAEHVLWDRRLRIGDAPLVARYHEWTWAELRALAHLDEAWSREAIEDIRNLAGPDDFSETQKVTLAKDQIALRDTSGRRMETEPHGIWEIHVDWSMLGSKFEIPGQEEWGGDQAPLLAHIHRRSGKILRLTGSPYLLPYKPFINLKWRHGQYGVAKALEQMQEIQTTLYNQSIDAQTRANSLWGKTRNPRHNREPIDPSRWLLVDSMDEVEPLNFGNSIQPSLSLLVASQTATERWMGSSDPLLGRETRSGGHPAPATSTLALLDQTDAMAAGTDTILQEELSRLGETIAILDQQFEASETGKIQQVLGQRDAAKLQPFLFPEEPIPGNIFFDVVALSRSENPDSMMRRTLMMAQAYQNYGALAAQGAQILDMPPNQVGPRVKAVWSKLLDAYGDLLTKFLDAGNIDEGERYLVQLEEIGVDRRNAFAQFVQEQQRAAGAEAAARGEQAAGGAGDLAATGSLVGAGNGAGGGAGRGVAGLGVLPG
jgi:hypothetical protein